jgi:hypothetical protein
MNAFRVTILALLVLTVGLMFYVFVAVIPARQSQYEMYHTQLKINEYEKRQMEHESRMARLETDVDTPEMAAARAAAEAEEKKSEEAVTAAEENSVLASAKRRQEMEETSADEDDVTQVAVLGSVTAYLEEHAVVLFKATGGSPVKEGLLIALRRDDYIVCEAMVDGVDEESGQYTAAVKQVKFGGVEDPTAEANRKPRTGDEVIVSPFMSGRDLRLESGNISDLKPEPAETPQPMPEVDAVFTPVP